MRRYLCAIDGYIYDEAKGDPVAGLPPGTRWEDVPADWTCPDCGAAKEDFELIAEESPLVDDANDDALND